MELKRDASEWQIRARVFSTINKMSTSVRIVHNEK